MQQLRQRPSQAAPGPGARRDASADPAAPIARSAGIRLAPRAEAGEDARLAAELHDQLLREVELSALLRGDRDEARVLASDALAVLAPGVGLPRTDPDYDRIIGMVLDDVLGYGPIQSLLDDASVQEVMINGPDTVYVESDGVLYRARVRFRDAAHVRRIGDRIRANIGRRVDEASPMVDARLPDGSRVNITIPPATPHGPTITIRKFRKDRYSLDQLIAAGTLDERMAEMLAACVTQRLNILVSGTTGSGKTTLLNALSQYIPRGERIVTIEDPLELALQQPHVVALEARPADMTGSNAISQRDLLRNTLRMRPDRIIVGEIRGGEAFEMMQAMNTGHDGSLSTVHANSSRDALARVENMVLMAGLQIPIRALREQIASAIDLIVHIERGVDGVRRVKTVTEITGMEQDHLTMQDLFRFDTRGRLADGRVQGVHRPTGLRPAFSDKLRAWGCDLRPELFLEGAL